MLNGDVHVDFITVFLPGIYAGTVMIGAHFGWPGYRYQHIPTYDHDENEASQTL